MLIAYKYKNVQDSNRSIKRALRKEKAYYNNLSITEGEIWYL